MTAKDKAAAKSMGGRKLTPKQESFCLVYLSTGNGSEAYRQSYEAGGMNENSVSRKAYELLQNVKITARLSELNEKATSAAVMTRQEALERLSNYARIDLADLIDFGSSEEAQDEEGRPIIQGAWRIKDSVMQDPKKMAAISELTAGRDGVKIKTHSPLQAIQQLAKMQGWESAAKHEHSGPGGGPIPLMPTTIELVAPNVES